MIHKRTSKKICYLCENKLKKPDYKDDKVIRRFINERGKIIPRRVSGSCARHQRQIARAVKRARQIAIIPFVAENIR
jgi:small subunit ribosomal protein S18